MDTWQQELGGPGPHAGHAIGKVVALGHVVMAVTFGTRSGQMAARERSRGVEDVASCISVCFPGFAETQLASDVA